ncbi:MAG: aldo/keto reductase [Saprospiraceae bacterium]|nr:aldo/keto reductase [Saprospiraceae bacterium]
MKYFTFANGDKMPLFGLGTWKSNDRDAYKAVREAIRIGYRHFDCAARYENEKEVGEAFSDAIAAGEVKRKELWITSKLWNNAHLPEHVQPNLEATLRDLQIEYIDLYLMHWPVALKPEVIFPAKGDEFLSLDEIPLIDTWKALEKCHKMGLARHIGVSNFNIPKIEKLIAQGGMTPECNQVESHPFLQQPKLFAYCQENHIAYTAYSPLGSQDRPARLKKETDPLILEHPTVMDIAKETNSTPGQVLIAWAVQRGSAVIPKSSNPGRLRQNFAAASMDLSADQMERIAALEKGFRYVDGSIWALEGSPYTVESLWNE